MLAPVSVRFRSYDDCRNQSSETIARLIVESACIPSLDLRDRVLPTSCRYRKEFQTQQEDSLQRPRLVLATLKEGTTWAQGST